MSINHEKKLIFINIPKNAGTSIIEAMGSENALFDISIEKYKEVYNEYWDSYLKFSVVRDPFDRFISAYKFIRSKENPNPLLQLSKVLESGEVVKLDNHPNYLQTIQYDINGFIEYLYENKDQHTFLTFPQSFFICDKYHQLQIDRVIKFEDLEKELNDIGIFNIKKLNKSYIEDKTKIILSSISKNLLYQMYEMDFKNFNYKSEKLQIDYE